MSRTRWTALGAVVAGLVLSAATPSIAQRAAGGDPPPGPRSEPAAAHVSPEDEVHFREIQRLRHDLQILEAQANVKKAEIQKAEAEFMLRHLMDHGGAKADAARDGSRGPELGGDQDRVVLATLDQPLLLAFPEPTTLDELIRTIRQSTACPGLPGGLSFYVDPFSLADAHLSMRSKVRLVAARTPLGRSLAAALEPLGLAFEVKDGLIVIHARRPAAAAPPRAVATPRTDGASIDRAVENFFRTIHSALTTLRS